MRTVRPFVAAAAVLLLGGAASQAFPTAEVLALAGNVPRTGAAILCLMAAFLGMARLSGRRR